MSRSLARQRKALQTSIRQLLSASHQDPWVFALEVGRILPRHLSCDLACLALVREHPQPHLVIREPGYRSLAPGEFARNPRERTLRIGGRDLAQSERSMLGHVAVTRRAGISRDVVHEAFYVAARKNIRAEIAAPVVHDGEILGVLNCESEQTAAFDSAHLDLLRLTARMIARTLETLLTQAGMRTRFAEAFRKVNSLLGSVPPGAFLEESNVLDRVARVIARSVQCPGCAIWLLGVGGSSLQVRGAFRRQRIGESHDRDSGAARWLAIDGLRPVHTHSGATGRAPRTGPPSFIVPLVFGGQPIGVIEVEGRDASSFTVADQALIQALQGQIAVSIQSRHVDWESRKQAREQFRRSSGLLKVFRTAQLNLDKALRETVRQIPGLCDGRFCSIFLWDETRQSFVLRASNGLDEELIGKAEYTRGEGLTGWVGQYGRSLNLVNRKPGKVSGGGAPQWKSKYQEGGPNRPFPALPWLGVPILVAGESIGVIRVSERMHPGFFSQADEQVLNMAAGFIGANIANLRDRQRRDKLRAELRESRNVLIRVIGEFGSGVYGRAEDSLRDALQIAAEGLGADQACLFKLNTGGAAEKSIWHPHLPISPGPDVAAVDAVCIEGFKHWNQARGGAAAGIVSSTGVLLKVGGRPVAVLVLDFRSRQEFDIEDRHLIESYADNLALCLEIVRIAGEVHASGAHEAAQDIAQDIHDSTLPIISGYIVRWVGGAKDMLRARKYSEAVSELTNAERAVSFLADECRSIMNLLRHDIAQDLGLINALKALREILAHEHPNLIFDLPPEDRNLPPRIKMHLFRIAEATLANAIRHAKARVIQLGLTVTSEQAELAVEDDGVGFDYDKAISSEGHHGLEGVLKRAKKLGTTPRIVTALGKGTSIRIIVPMKGEQVRRATT